MTKEQEEAISTMKHWIDYEKENKDKINKADELIEIQETVLSMLQEQREENKKKDKIIDYMIDWIRERSIYAVDSHDMLKQYFERKVEE